MNSFKCNKFIVMALTFVMLVILARPPLPAASGRRGATVEVAMTDGSLVRGELLTVKADALLIYDQNAGQGRSLDLQQVASVKLLKKPKIGKGLLIGFGIGLGFFLRKSVAWLTTSEHLATKDLWLPVITGLSGGILGGFAGIPEKFALPGESTQSARQNLERLKRYAREQDFEKPVAN